MECIRSGTHPAMKFVLFFSIMKEMGSIFYIICSRLLEPLIFPAPVATRFENTLLFLTTMHTVYVLISVFQCPSWSWAKSVQVRDTTYQISCV